MELSIAGWATQERDWSGKMQEGKKKGELPPSNPRIVQFTLDPRFTAYLEQSGIELPQALQCAADYSAKRSTAKGSPSLTVEIWSS